MRRYSNYMHKFNSRFSMDMSPIQQLPHQPQTLQDEGMHDSATVHNNGRHTEQPEHRYRPEWRLRGGAAPLETCERIAMVVHKFPPESVGGTELYCWSLARQLTHLGHEVHIFYPTAELLPGEERIEREGVYLWRVPLPESRLTENPVSQYWHTYRDLGIENAFARFLAEVRPQIVHFQHVQGVSARLIELAAPIPCVVTLHDYWYFCANSQLIRPDRRPCEGPSSGCLNCVDCATERADLKWMRALRPLVALPFAYRNHYLRKVVEHVSLFIAPSEFLRRKYIEHGFAAERITVIENGVDEEKLAALPKSPLPEPVVRPHFGFLGSLAWQKGVHILVEAFNRLDENASLTIYGSEQLFPDYVAQIKEIARHPNIRFAGLLDPRQVGAALRQLDCLVVPSLWYENSPLVIQEAYGVGVPVVASRLGALAEKVEDGHMGRLFEAGNVEDLHMVLRELVAEPHRLKEMARQVVSAPTMSQHATQLLSIYSHLCGRPGQ
jgi:glycosyltransferase involved in cell wall biosynthesis